MNTDKLETGLPYIASFKGRFGRCPVTYLGRGKHNGKACYDFYDGVCRSISELNRVCRTTLGKGSILHLDEENVNRYVSTPVEEDLWLILQ